MTFPARYFFSKLYSSSPLVNFVEATVNVEARLSIALGRRNTPFFSGGQRVGDSLKTFPPVNDGEATVTVEACLSIAFVRFAFLLNSVPSVVSLFNFFAKSP
ncbi:hypothetical protein Csa_016398 [Cucumis sativus]|uniref:Uncharacterized protein n=1 Tax=Cucumis sativus TaxID=3659 RepID=A0A0A0K585_CUCSA|nr:hypothetical protein Csa_016398 [Cucumis sativus]